MTNPASEECRELELLRGAVWSLADALGKRCLADANATREAPNGWPAGQEWDELVPTSHSIMRHRGYAEAGLDRRAMIALLCDEYGNAKPYDADALHYPAAASRAPSPERSADDNA